MEKGATKPDQVSYTVALGAWLSSKRIGLEEALQARELLDRAIQNHEEFGWNCKPDSYVFSTMIQICGRVNGTALERDQALNLALCAMKECTSGSYGTASHVAYASCMKAVNHLCSDEVKRCEILRTLFDECQRAGQVSKHVVIAMTKGAWKESAPPMLAEWSRRVPPQNKPRIER